jgi:hypothetical protein
MRSKKAALSVLLLLCISGGWFPKAAQSGAPGTGDLDPTYGTGGKVKTEFTPTANLGGAALQPDGKTVIAGIAGTTVTRRMAVRIQPSVPPGETDISIHCFSARSGESA